MIKGLVNRVKEYNLKEACELLEISPSTIRRWVKLGKLEANLKNGPYGEEYFVTHEAIEKALAKKTIVVQPHRKLDIPPEALELLSNKALEGAMAQQMHQMTLTLIEQITDLKREQSERINTLENEILKLQSEMAAAKETREDRLDQFLAEMREINKQKSWWQFWK